MPQSLSAVYLHLIFSTKNRRRFFQNRDQRAALHAYLGGLSKTLGCPPIITGGVEDHVHQLAELGRSIRQADWVKELKRVSNSWLKDQSKDFALFQWQGGYATFSVSYTDVEAVKEYIRTQEEHHRTVSYQDELRALLRRHEIKWDERYIWD
jgi:REP element-mobilizing transposase RayT